MSDAALAIHCPEMTAARLAELLALIEVATLRLFHLSAARKAARAYLKTPAANRSLGSLEITRISAKMAALRTETRIARREIDASDLGVDW